MNVLTFSHGAKKLGTSPQGEYLRSYLKELGAKTVVVEDQYIDKDYLIDYCNFYARSFEPSDKYTTRLHFFKKKFKKTEFEKKFFYDENFQDELNELYLGFVVIKPIGFDNKYKFIGRTVLKTYSSEAYNRETKSKEKRHFTTFDYFASLYGVKLKIESLPYQTQDSVVAACATTAIWTSLHALNDLFGTIRQSPFEITETSVSSPGIDRNFPSTGLDIIQMKEYFNSIGLETESIYVANYKCAKAIPEIIKAFLNFKLPIIACIKLIKDDPKNPDNHAVVISGYRSDDEGNLTEIYVHDDRIGPYSRVMPHNGDKNFLHWSNEWITMRGYKNVQVERFLIPLYPKIRLSFNKIFDFYSQRKKEYSKYGYHTTLSLIELNKYKNELLGKEFENKAKILVEPMAKYNWLIRVESHNSPHVDFVFDATSVLSPSVTTVMFLTPK